MSSSVSRGQHLQASGMVITLGFYGPNVPLTELEMAWIILPKDSRCVYIKTQTGAIHDNHNYHASTTIRKVLLQNQRKRNNSATIPNKY